MKASSLKKVLSQGKPSMYRTFPSFVALICSLAINSFNAIHQPAVAGNLPQHWHIAEALDGENLSASKTENLVVTQVGEKYGYKDNNGNLAIAPRFDNAYEFFDGLAAVRVDGKWG
jgi:hypothetical protein